jgi:hypothetical protein
MVCVTKMEEGSPFKTKVTFIPRNIELMLPLKEVLVHRKFQINQPVKSYTVYLESEDRNTAKKEGIEIIKQYRLKEEGL